MGFAFPIYSHIVGIILRHAWYQHNTHGIFIYLCRTLPKFWMLSLKYCSCFSFLFLFISLIGIPVMQKSEDLSVHRLVLWLPCTFYRAGMWSDFDIQWHAMMKSVLPSVCSWLTWIQKGSFFSLSGFFLFCSMDAHWESQLLCKTKSLKDMPQLIRSLCKCFIFIFVNYEVKVLSTAVHTKPMHKRLVIMTRVMLMGM